MTPKVLTVVGARPQFVKAAMVSHIIEADGLLAECIVHTGQHFDRNMSQTFFDELKIPEPKVNMGISGGTHAGMTARMLTGLEEAMVGEQPDVVLLYGDTNSTLAGALAAAKLHIPIAHVEAGARTHSLTNPEEINRLCADHVSTLLFACTEANLGNLAKEGLAERASFVGDLMYDAFLYGKLAMRPPDLTLCGVGPCGLPGEFYYLTCHREENTSDPATLRSLLGAMDALDLPVVYPVHPRNRKAVSEALADGLGGNVIACEPVGYLESLWLVCHARQVITDSGGLQREAFFAGVKCTTVLGFEVWPETMVGNRNLLAEPNRDSILAAMAAPQRVDESYEPFGDGNAATRIVKAISEHFRS